MSQENVSLVRSIYDALAAGDAKGALGRLSENIVWNEAENFPYADGNPYVGPGAVAQGVLARLGSEWNGFAVAVENLHDAGDTIVATGRYHGVCKATDKEINAQFAHIWSIEAGKAARFQQYVDTLQVARAVARTE